MSKPYPKCNRPCTLPHVLALLASLLKMPVGHVASITTANARAAFKLPAVLYNGSLPAERAAYDANAFVEPLLVGEKKKEVPKGEGKKGKRLNLLNDEQIAALLHPGQNAFVIKGFVYAGTPGVISSLDAMKAANNPALNQSMSEFLAANLITLIHDPNVRKKKRNHMNRVRDRAQGRSVRRRIEHRGHHHHRRGGHHHGGHGRH